MAEGPACPVVLVVSYSDTNPVDLIKEILQVDCSPTTSYCDSIQAFAWCIDTKYYTANVHLCGVKDDQFGNKEFLEKSEALIVHFDSNKVATFNRVKMLVSLLEGFETDVRILVCDNCSGENSAVQKRTAQEWCLETGFELVELHPDEGSDTEDDFAETTGMKRIIQALHAHTWSNLVLKENPIFYSPKLERLLNGDSSKEDKTILDAVEKGLRSVNIEEKEDSVTHVAPNVDLLRIFGDEDTEEESFEGLFAKFQQMKEKAKDLPLSERKIYAEKVAIAFWKAMGGDDEEIAGLNSDSD